MQIDDFLPNMPLDLKTPGQFVFAQVACKSGDEGIEEVNGWGMLLAAVCLLMISFFVFSIQLVQSEA